MTIKGRLQKLEKEQRRGALVLYQELTAQGVTLFELGENGETIKSSIPEPLPRVKAYEKVSPQDWD
jgi:hypothetical protein